MLKWLFPVALIGCLAIPFLVNGPDGKPVMSLPDSFSGDDSESTDTQPPATHYYRWQDEQGRWHFSDNRDQTAPAPDSAEQMSMRPATNIMDKLPENRAADNGAQDRRYGDGGERRMPFPTTIDPRDIPKLIDDAKDVQRLMDERSEQLQGY